MIKDSRNLKSNQEIERLAKGAGITFLGGIISNGLRFLYNIVLAKYLGSRLLGIYYLAQLVINISSQVALFGLQSGVLKFISQYRAQEEEGRIKGTLAIGFRISFFGTIALMICIYLTSPYISRNVFHEDEILKLLRWLLLSIPFLTLTMIALSGIRAYQVVKYEVFIKLLLIPSLNLIIALAAFYLGAKLIGVALAFIISNLIGFILSWYCLKLIVVLDKKIKPIYETLTVLKFSFPLFFVGTLNYLLNWTDNWMLGNLSTSSNVAIYNVVFQMTFIVIMLSRSFNSIFSPIISDLYHRGDMPKLENLLKVTTKWIFSISLFIVSIFILIPKQLLSIFGSDFVIGVPSLIILCCGQLVNASLGCLEPVLIMSGHPKINLVNLLCICMFNAILNYFLIPKYGVTGAALATSISVSMVRLISLVEVKMILQMHPFKWELLKPLFSGAIAVTISYYLIHILKGLFPFASILLPIMCFGIIYICSMYLLGFSEEDKLIIKLAKSKL